MISQFETWRYVRTVKKKSSQLRSLPTETNCKPQTFSSKPSQKGKARNGEVFTLYTRRQKKQNVCVYIYIVDKSQTDLYGSKHHRMAIPKGRRRLSDISCLGERAPCHQANFCCTNGSNYVMAAVSLRTKSRSAKIILKPVME